jgi:hypothetical protein
MYDDNAVDKVLSHRQCVVLFSDPDRELTMQLLPDCDDCAKRRAAMAAHMKALVEWARHPMSGPPPGIMSGLVIEKPSDPALIEPPLSAKTPDAKVD